MTEPAIFTIVSNNYLHFARTLLQSAAQHHPQARRYCVIVDTDDGPSHALADEFEAIALDRLALPDGDDFLFQYTVLELNTAVKPWALQHLLDRGHEQVFYIDPDIQIYQPLRDVQERLNGGADIVLTPHLLAPMSDGGHPSELDIRRAGTYNLGFCAVRDTPNTRRFLFWWQGKLQRDCVVAPDRGVFVDQSWVDLVPGLFDNVAILRHPGYNVAYWNIAQREVTRRPDPSCPWLVDGQAMVFFHFSGLNPLDPHKISKHQNRFTLENADSAVAGLVMEYSKNVVANGIHQYRVLPYGFGVYDNGTPIEDVQRVRFRSSAALREKCAGKPFSHADMLAPIAATPKTSEADPPAPQLAPAVHAGYSLADELPYSVEGRRLQKIYIQLLDRQPEDGAIRTRLTACATPLGSLRTLLAVGLAKEARARPGWLQRLLGLAADVGLTPQWVKRHALVPLLNRLPDAHLSAQAFQPVRSEPVAAVADPAVASPVVTEVERPEYAANAILPPAVLARPERLARAQLAPSGVLQRLPVPTGINLVGYLAAELGIGEAARSLARACHAAGVPFSGTDVGYQSQNLQRDTSILNLATRENFPIDLLYVNADQTLPTVQHLQTIGQPRGRYTIGFWHWEQPQLPVPLLQAFAHVDEVWVPSTFVQDAVAAVSPVPVFKVPHALELTVTPGVQRSQFGLPQGRLLVLVMYDFDSYQHRKNPQAAIAAYRKAARQCPELQLVVKTINSQRHAQAYAELRATVQDLPHVRFIDEFLTRQQTWDLQSCCDILLSLHRAEGFGLAPAEMMYLGKAVVATGWSANMDFMNVDNSMPVHFRLEPLARDVGAYPAGPLWAEADTDYAAACLVQLARDPALAGRLGHQAAQDIRRHLNPAEVGRQIRQRLQMLGHWHPQLLKP